jgi:hypothetical protein
MAVVDALLDRIGRRIAGRLEMPCRGYTPFTPADPVTLLRTLRRPMFCWSREPTSSPQPSST